MLWIPNKRDDERKKYVITVKKYQRIAVYTVVVVAAVVLNGQPALAEEAGHGWRGTYDTVLMWVNFIILATLMYKLAAGPLKGFLGGEKKKLAAEIDRAEQEKAAAEEKIRDTRKEIASSDERLKSVKQRIIAQGEKQKQVIIDEAHQQSRVMVAEAKRRVSSQILEAREKFRAELVDAAIGMALEKLPGEITEEENQKYVDQFMESAAK